MNQLEKETIKETTELGIEIIDSELLTLSQSLDHYYKAGKLIEKRFEALVRRKHKLQRTLVTVTICPPKIGAYSQPVMVTTPTKDSVIKKIKDFSRNQLTELELRLDAFGIGQNRVKI